MPGKKKKQLSNRASVRSRRPRTGPPGASAAAATNTSSITAVLNSGKLRELYSTMLQCRMLMERGQALSASLKEGVIDEADAGREAVLVGAATHVLPGDSIVVAHGSFLARYIRRTPLASIAARLSAEGMIAARRGAGEEHGRASPAQLSIIKGMTLARKATGSPAIVLAFPGDDAAALAFHYDALALAARHKLPLVCLVETGPSFEWTAERQNTQNASASHFPEIAVDGCDVVAVFRVAQEAVRRARAGQGPSLIQCVMPGKSSAGRKTHTAIEAHRDPLALMKNYLRRKGLWSDAWQGHVQDGFRQELNAALAAAQHPPDSTLPFDDVYSAEPRHGASPAASAQEKIAVSDS